MNFKPNIGDIFLNKYELISLIGQGAFGSVYRARDTKLDRLVAIKFICETSTTIDRFTDELDAIKGLDHPNIVRLYDYDILRGGIPCFVMEYINGREVGDILAEKGHFELINIAEIAQQVLDALVETHRQNIIHCDLKPENIMLTNVGARNDVVKLIDFGIASLLHKEEDEERAKLLVGTPQYMAPEQITHGEIGPWTDIYAFGLIMAELYTGDFVFNDDDPRNILRMQLHSPIILPHTLACSELGPIISRATQKDIAKRYRTTKEFYDDICDALQSMRESQKKIEKNDNNRGRVMSAILDDLEDLGVLSQEIPSTATPVLKAFLEKKQAELQQQQTEQQTAEKQSSVQQQTTEDQAPAQQSQTKLETENLGLESLACSINMAQDSLKETSKAEIKEPTIEANPLTQETSNPATACSIQQPSIKTLDNKKLEPKRNKTQSNPNSTPSKKVESSKSHTIPIIVGIAILVFLGIIGFSLMKKAQNANSDNDNSAEQVHTKNANSSLDEAKGVVLFSTKKKTSEAMALAAALSGEYGISLETSRYTPYRIVGTPTTASVYINNTIACHKTPCTINIFGDPTKVNLELRKDQKVTKFSLADRDPKEKIIVILK